MILGWVLVGVFAVAFGTTLWRLREERLLRASHRQTIEFLQRSLGDAERGARECAERLAGAEERLRFAGDLWCNLRAGEVRVKESGNNFDVGPLHAARSHLDELFGWRPPLPPPPVSHVRAVGGAPVKVAANG